MSTVLRPKLLAATRPEEAARALASRHGPPDERPALRKDLGIHRQVQLGEVNWIVKNPATMKYHQFKSRHWQIVRLFDGKRTREQIRKELSRLSEQPIAIELVLEYEEFLRKLDLIEQSVAERNLGLLDRFNSFRHQNAEEQSEGFNIFFIKFHVFDPDRFLNKTVKYVRWIWTPPVAIATVIACLWTLTVFVRNWEPIFRGTMDLYHFAGKPLPQVLQFFTILCIVATIHEFAHGYATKKYGGEIHDIGFALFYFTPAFYCDSSDTLMFENRWHRFWTTIAGMYSELIICSAATALWVYSYPDTILHEAAYKTMLYTGVSAVLFNINPLIKVDGYYAISSLLQIPDLRETAWKTIGAWFQRTVLRLPVEMPPATRRKRIIYVSYGILSMMYTATIMFFVYKLFRNFYFRYFPDFGVVFLILTLFYVFKKKVRTTRRVGKLLYLDKKEWLMSPRSRLPLAIAGGTLLVLLAIPWSHRKISGEATLIPERQVRIEVPEDSRVAQVFVREGDSVRAGQPLFQLTSADPIGNIAQHSAERERFLKKSSAARASANAGLAYQTQQQASSEQIALTAAEARRDYLLVKSPIAGRVLTARVEDLEGRYLTAGSLLGEIGDCGRMVAEIPVSERLLDYLQVGAPASAFVRASSKEFRRGTIASISPATLEQPATADGGVVPSARPDQFTVRAVFDNSDGGLVPGSEVRVKLSSRREGHLSRAWSALWRWFRSVVW